MYNGHLTLTQLKRYQKVFAYVSTSCKYFNSLPHGMILDWSKLKGFADEKINVSEKFKCVSITGKRENTGYQHFPLFRCFQKPPGL